MATDPPSVVARPQLWRISDRATFADLRRRGRRARVGALTVTWLAPEATSPADPPRVAVAVGRGAGAVRRNRIRRRIRAALRELQRDGHLPTGAYLVGATLEVASMPWADLVHTLTEAVATATAR